MANGVHFFGPLHIYMRRRGGRYYAQIDPFSVIGIARTEDGAVDKACELLASHFEGLAQALRKYGPRKVEILTPLDDEDKQRCYCRLHAGVLASVGGRKVRPDELPTRAEPFDTLGPNHLRRLRCWSVTDVHRASLAAH